MVVLSQYCYGDFYFCIQHPAMREKLKSYEYYYYYYHGSDFALRRPRHLLAVARNVPQSVTVPLLLPHRLFGTACGRT